MGERTRFSITMDDEQLEWIDEYGKTFDWSRAQVLRRLVDDARGTRPLPVPISDDDDGNRMQALRERIEAVENERTDADGGTDVVTGEDEPTDEEIRALLRESRYIGDDEAGTRCAAVRAVWNRVRDSGPEGITSGDLVDELYSADAYDMTESSWKRGILAVARQLDGVEGPPRGGQTWTATTDE